jgi:hypothetical protein
MVRSDDGTTYYAAGAWRDADGGALAEPLALVAARPNLSDVIDPEGELETTGRSIRPPTTSSRDGGAGPAAEGTPDADTSVDAGLAPDGAPLNTQ